VERPRRKERFARLIQRRGRAFWPTFGRRRLRRRSQPALVAMQGGGGLSGVLLSDISKAIRPVGRAAPVAGWPRSPLGTPGGAMTAPGT
jgi:hypothetical protein